MIYIACIAYRTSFHVISCWILHHFMSYFIHFIACITRIAHTSRMSRITHFANSAHFMYCTVYHVILCIISCHFIMKMHCIVIHTIYDWREKKYGQNATLLNRAPPEWGVLIRRIKMPPDWGIFTNDKNVASRRFFHSSRRFLLRVSLLTKNSSGTQPNSHPRVV